MPLMPISDAADARLPGDLNVKGWNVRTEADEKDVGTVDDILVDEGGRVRYLDVDLGLMRRHVLLPIGRARADASKNVVWVSDMNRDALKQVPDYDHDPARVDRDYERMVASAYGRPGRERDAADAGRGDLAELSDLKRADVAANEPNPRGWEVYAADGRRVGKVEELIVDTSLMKVRYFDVDLAARDLGFDGDRHILVPADHARLDRDDKHVFVEGLSADALSDYPVYGGLPLARDFDDRLRQHYGPAHSAEARMGDDDLFDESAFLSGRGPTRAG